MVTVWNLYLAFGLMAVTNDPLKLNMWNLLWRQITNSPMNSYEILLTRKELQIWLWCENFEVDRMCTWVRIWSHKDNNNMFTISIIKDISTGLGFDPVTFFSSSSRSSILIYNNIEILKGTYAPAPVKCSAVCILQYTQNESQTHLKVICFVFL